MNEELPRRGSEECSWEGEPVSVSSISSAVNRLVACPLAVTSVSILLVAAAAAGDSLD